MQVASLEAERGKLVRALVREVGEEVPLAKLLDEGSDWKGRREQVIALRDKVKALKAQLVGGAARPDGWCRGTQASPLLLAVSRCLIGWPWRVRSLQSATLGCMLLRP